MIAAAATSDAVAPGTSAGAAGAAAAVVGTDAGGTADGASVSGGAGASWWYVDIQIYAWPPWRIGCY